MSETEMLARAATELGNHVAHVVRASNELDVILGDLARHDDIMPVTRGAVLSRVAEMSREFREGHLKQMISAVNEVVDISSRMWQAEPVAVAPAEPGAEYPAGGVPAQEVPDGGGASPA